LMEQKEKKKKAPKKESAPKQPTETKESEESKNEKTQKHKKPKEEQTNKPPKSHKPEFVYFPEFMTSLFAKEEYHATPKPKNLGLSKKTLSVKEFNEVPIGKIFANDSSLKDNYDIARKICKFYDGQFGDTDTVCMVAESGKQPAISYWVKGDYVRKHKNIQGKHILVYRACKHRPAKEPIVSGAEFEEYVKKISIKHEKDSVHTICDLIDKKFGMGCHYARSTIARANYDIYSRFSDKYDAGFKLKSGAYIIAWRR